jgi:hypothetical protein
MLRGLGAAAVVGDVNMAESVERERVGTEGAKFLHPEFRRRVNH